MQEITDPSTRIKQHGFSFLPPQEKGWYVVERDPGHIGLMKEGASQDETLGIRIALFKLPLIEDAETFLELVKKGRAADSNPERFIILENQEELDQSHSDFCVKYHSKSKDLKAAKRSGRSGFMILEIQGYDCRHPNHKNFGLNFEYSRRYYPENQDLSFLEKSSQFLSEVAFEE